LTIIEEAASPSMVGTPHRDVVAAWHFLDLDHVGAHVGQHQRAAGPATL
jgi:hypothetical protein